MGANSRYRRALSGAASSLARSASGERERRFFAEEEASGAQLRRTTAERGGREVEHDGAALAKLGGGA
jgi:hypothetical protein